MKVKNELSLRQEMQDLLDDYGVWILLQRQSKTFHCQCWNEKYQEGRSDCTYCGGSGLMSRLERHKVRKIGAVIAITEPNLTVVSELGHTVTNQYRWYFAHDAWPRAGDMIYEVEWDLKNQQKPARLIASHYVNVSNDHRGDNGRIEYWNAASRSVTTDMKVQNLIVRSMGSVSNYYAPYLGGGQPK